VSCFFFLLDVSVIFAETFRSFASQLYLSSAWQCALAYIFGHSDRNDVIFFGHSKNTSVYDRKTTSLWVKQFALKSLTLSVSVHFESNRSCKTMHKCISGSFRPIPETKIYNPVHPDQTLYKFGRCALPNNLKRVGKIEHRKPYKIKTRLAKWWYCSQNGRTHLEYSCSIQHRLVTGSAWASSPCATSSFARSQITTLPECSPAEYRATTDWAYPLGHFVHTRKQNEVKNKRSIKTVSEARKACTSDNSEAHGLLYLHTSAH